MCRPIIQLAAFCQTLPFFRVLLFALVIAQVGLTPKLSRAEEVEYTDLQAIRALDPEDAVGALVEFEATVTYVSGMQEFLFVQSGTDAIFVYKPDVAHVAAGQHVRVRGRLSKGDLLPIVLDSELEVLGEGTMPTPERASVIGLEHDCRYLDFEFDILQSRIGVSESQLYARTKTNQKVCIEVKHLGGIDSSIFSSLAGGRVRVSGVLGLQLDGGAFREPGMPENRIIGYKIFCNSTNSVKVVDEDRFASREPAKEVGLSFIDRDSFQEDRFLTVGQICLVEYEDSYADSPEFVVCDGSTFVRFKLQSADDLKPGMVMRIGGTKTVDSSGQPQFNVDYLCDLTQAEFPSPEQISVQFAAQSFQPNHRISVEGIPLRVDSRNGQPHLILAEGDSTIAVRFQEDAIASLASLDPKIAGRVRVTGVTKVDEECDLQLVVARAGDAELVERKASLSRIVAIGLATLMAICALAALWIKLLRSQVSQKQRFESIFDNAGCPIIVFNGDLAVVDANQLAANLLEYSKEELRALSINQITRRMSREKLQRMLILTKEDHEVTVFPTKILTRNNKSLDVEVHCRILTKSEDPAKATYIAIFPDVTARNRYENELKKARDEAIKANKAKSRFVASMSHELRTPLNGVIGMTQLLESTELTSIQADYLAACRTSGETLLTVIGDVLDFSKMEAGKLELKPRETNLIPFIENVVRATSLQKATRHVDLASFVDSQLGRSVMVDSDRFRQVIFNLIGNAAKFTSEGSITVRVTCDKVTDQYADVRFVVADTGIGIPEDRIENLFEAFEQCDSSTTRQYGGTGLGLTICKQIVDLMDGQIHARSIEGEGSQFIVEVRLPFAQQASDECQTKITCVAGSPRVAVLGMSQPITELLDETFRKYGVDARFFEATSQLPHGEFDVVFFNSCEGVDSVTDFVERQHGILGADRPALVPVVSASCISGQSEWSKLGVEKPLYKPISQTRIMQVLGASHDRHETLAAEKSSLANLSDRALRVLICEDVPVNQMFAREICRKAGIDCVVSENGRVGIETLEKDSSFDVIFMDCHMPVMDGFEASRKIRDMAQEGLLPNIPVIALTASALSGDREKCIEAGMSDYLAKPFEIEQFLNKIRKHVDWTAKETQSNSDVQMAPEQSITTSSVFDITELVEQFDDREFALDVARQFSESLPGYRSDLEEFLEVNDPNRAFMVAHRIKGSAGLVRAERISDLAFQMESTARDGQLEQLRSQIEELVEEFENFTNAYREEKKLSPRD